MNYKTRQPFPHAAYVEGQRNFTYFDRSLTSGLTDVVIESPGDFLYIDQASTGVVSVELNMRQGGTLAPILLAAGGSIECDFSSIKLNATAQLNKTVRVIVGNGAKIKGGANVNPTSEVITTIPGGKFISAADRSFMNYFGIAASVGNFSMAQLFNPTANTRTLYVTKLIPAAVNMSIAGYSTALSALNGYAPSMKVDGAASTGQCRSEQAAGSLYTQYFGLAVANTPFVFERPLCLAPGKGIVVAPQGTNLACYVTLEFFEE